jgi:hypothetical protein
MITFVVFSFKQQLVVCGLHLDKTDLIVVSALSGANF